MSSGGVNMKNFEKKWKIKCSKNQNARFSVLNDIVFWSRKVLKTEKSFSKFGKLNFIKKHIKWKQNIDFQIFDCHAPILLGQISSTSVPGGNQVDGLPPAPSCEDCVPLPRLPSLTGLETTCFGELCEVLPHFEDGMRRSASTRSCRTYPSSSMVKWSCPIPPDFV